MTYLVLFVNVCVFMISKRLVRAHALYTCLLYAESKYYKAFQVSLLYDVGDVIMSNVLIETIICLSFLYTSVVKYS
jgi:hypothetical protein